MLAQGGVAGGLSTLALIMAAQAMGDGATKVRNAAASQRRFATLSGSSTLRPQCEAMAALKSVAYLLLAAYGALAAILNGIGIWKFWPRDLFSAFEEATVIALVVLAVLGITRRVQGRFVWSAVAVLVVVDIVLRLLT